MRKEMDGLEKVGRKRRRIGQDWGIRRSKGKHGKKRLGKGKRFVTKIKLQKTCSVIISAGCKPTSFILLRKCKVYSIFAANFRSLAQTQTIKGINKNNFFLVLEASTIAVFFHRILGK